MSSLSQPEPLSLAQPLPGATIGQSVSRFWRKYATFTGRASRSEYWWWYLVAVVVNVVLSSLGRLDGAAGQTFQTLSVIWGVAIFVPTLALLWRRLHDTGRSGLWALAPIVLAAVGGVLLVVGAFALHVASAGEGSVVPGGIVFALAGIALVASLVIVFVLTLLPSHPSGARFDRRY
ncbi:DUF805 domain-containing protein [Frigoribacterium sp. 2-23]|uniref:DUF805 domain-containing protein n=1 Tax=Frigoribacterium sp. 2-23 TaxID=3415006 RepID=UPI003C6FF1F9